MPRYFAVFKQTFFSFDTWLPNFYEAYMKTSVAFIDADLHINQGLGVLLYIYKNKTYIYFRFHNWQQPD